ncbi:hypothetical protein QR680_015236 [Steinernema hermaphroditum]|uniref:Uncharacterized protein n=1 Tax=Steinernema hermaphroditum TaxID=289476 RepID=A0AA39LK93_9BILA|nr:hypothetical protein QR680_015236 [Steinernema hermaphroditum]
MVDIHHFVFGLIHLVSAIVFTPVLMKLFHVLIANKEYRKYECYRIMAQQVLFHVICGCSYVFYGLGVMLDSEIFGLVKGAHFFAINAFNSIIIITLVLAINRLCLICHIHIPRWISPVLQVTTWLIFIALTTLMYSPLSEFWLGPDRYTVQYGNAMWFSRNYKQLRSLSCTVIIFAALTIYTIITAYVLYRKFSFNANSTSKAELKIAMQAGLTFLFNFFTIVLYKWIYHIVLDSPWTRNLYAFFQMANFLYLPAIVYLAFNKMLRKQVFSLQSNGVSSMIHGTQLFVNTSK